MSVHITRIDANMLHKAEEKNNKIRQLKSYLSLPTDGQDSVQICQPPPARGE